ncbi:MAG: glutathione S-transferase family protein [Sedimenticolaceae bacterium]
MESHQQAAAAPLKFYSAWYCPFAQRAWMALLHKEIPFEYIEVDPYRKSRWWLEISRNRAKVPVIVAPAGNATGSTTVIDSTRIVEYLEDLEPHVNRLFPCDPNEKAEHRFWVDHINERVVPYLYRYLEAEQPGEYRDTSQEALLEGVRELSNAMSPTGPFFNGTALTAVDLLLIPFAYRIDALLGHYRDFSLPTAGASWSRYQRWYESMCGTAIFQGTLKDPDHYRQRLIEHYLPYSQGKGQKDVTEVR